MNRLTIVLLAASLLGCGGQKDGSPDPAPGDCALVDRECTPGCILVQMAQVELQAQCIDTEYPIPTHCVHPVYGIENAFEVCYSTEPPPTQDGRYALGPEFPADLDPAPWEKGCPAHVMEFLAQSPTGCE